MSNFSLKFQIVPFVFFILVSCENNYNNSETKETTSVLNTKTEIKKTLMKYLLETLHGCQKI
jgi:hypothetical protein